MTEKLKCDYCGQEKQEVSFYIGASLEPEWTMVEGTGKVTCPNCWEKGKHEGKAAIERATGIKQA